MPRRAFVRQTLFVGFLPGVILLAACSTMKQSTPARTASEQLLISQAADSAAEQLMLKVDPERMAYLDTGNFEGTDSKYAISAIKVSLMRQGIHLVNDKAKADTIIEIRSGALSIDQSETVVGTPSTNLAVLQVPELAVFKSETNEGVAKFAAFAYDAKSGELLSSAGPVYGFSRRLDNQALSSISWGTGESIYGRPESSDGILPGLPTSAPTTSTTNTRPGDVKPGAVKAAPAASQADGQQNVEVRTLGPADEDDEKTSQPESITPPPASP